MEALINVGNVAMYYGIATLLQDKNYFASLFIFMILSTLGFIFSILWYVIIIFFACLGGLKVFLGCWWISKREVGAICHPKCRFKFIQMRFPQALWGRRWKVTKKARLILCWSIKGERFLFLLRRSQSCSKLVRGLLSLLCRHIYTLHIYILPSGAWGCRRRRRHLGRTFPDVRGDFRAPSRDWFQWPVKR